MYICQAKFQAMMSRKRRKRRKKNCQKIVTVQFIDLPDEIILKVMSNFKGKELLQLGQVSKRIRNISHDNSLWLNVDLSDQKVSTDFVKMILSNGCKYLNLNDSKLVGNVSLRKTSNLLALDLSDCEANTDVGEELLASCNSLKVLYPFGFSLTQKMVDSVCGNGKQLKTLGLDGARTKRKRLEKLLDSCHSLKEVELESFAFSSKMIKSLSYKNHLTLQKVDFAFCRELDIKSIQLIIDNCIEIKEFKLCYSQLSERSLHYLVNNLTTKIEILSLHYQDHLNDAHILGLVGRCKKLSALDLGNTNIKNDSIIGIIDNLKFTLKELSVMHCTLIGYPVLLKLKDMDQLRILQCNEEYSKKLSKKLSNIHINGGEEENLSGSYGKYSAVHEIGRRGFKGRGFATY